MKRTTIRCDVMSATNGDAREDTAAADDASSDVNEVVAPNAANVDDG